MVLSSVFRDVYDFLLKWQNSVNTSDNWDNIVKDSIDIITKHDNDMFVVDMVHCAIKYIEKKQKRGD